MPLNHSEVSMFRNVDEARRFYASTGVVWGIPFIVASTAGLFVGGLVSLVGWRFFADPRPFITFLITTLLVAVIVWARLTWVVFGKIDLGQRKPANVRIEWVENDGRTLKFIEFDTVDDDQLFKVCKMVMGGGTLSIRNLRSCLGEAQVTAFRLELIDKRVAVFDEQNEVKLTPRGVKFFRNVAHYPIERVNNA